MKAKRYSTEFKSSIVALYNEGRSANSLANEQVQAFQQRRLASQYAAIFLDATYLPLKRDTVQKEAVHIAIGYLIRDPGVGCVYLEWFQLVNAEDLYLRWSTPK